MNTLNSCPPDYSKFTLEQLEQTYALLRSLVYCAGSALGVPRTNDAAGRSPAALYIEDRAVNPNLDDLAAMASYLRGVKFGTRDQNERALLLLLKYELDFGEPSVASIREAIEAVPA